jgi:hypothetical protein
VSKAGIEVWLKLFVNMRGSCSDDLERRGIAEKAIDPSPVSVPVLMRE